VHLLQIWMLPTRAGLTPRYDQTRFPVAEQPGKLHLVGAKDARDGAVRHPARTSTCGSASCARATGSAHELAPGRHAWVQVAKGAATRQWPALERGDGAAVTGEQRARDRGRRRTPRSSSSTWRERSPSGGRAIAASSHSRPIAGRVGDARTSVGERERTREQRLGPVDPFEPVRGRR
jgi:hypothetical protein